MIPVTSMAAQGDVLFRRIDTLPPKTRDVTPDDGWLVVAHSDHVVISRHARLMAGENPMVCYLQSESHMDVTHCRPWDTHATIRLLSGIWEVRRQREWAPEGWRRVED